MQYSIPLQPDTKPSYAAAFRMLHSQRAKVDEFIWEILQMDVIEESNSLWNFPLFLVPEGSDLRPVVDFRALNKVTQPDSCPVSVLTNLLQRIGVNNHVFSIPDLLSGFWQVELDDNSKPLTAFSTHCCH